MFASSPQTQLGGSSLFNRHLMQHNTGGNGGGENANSFSSYTSPRDSRALSSLGATQSHYSSSSWEPVQGSTGNNTNIASAGLPSNWSDHQPQQQQHHHHQQSYPGSVSHDHTPTTSPTLESSPSNNDTMYRGSTNIMQSSRMHPSASYSSGISGGGGGQLSAATAPSYASLNNFGASSSNSALSSSSASAYQQDAPHYYGLGANDQAYFGQSGAGSAPSNTASSSYFGRTGDLDTGSNSATGMGVSNAYTSHFSHQQPASSSSSSTQLRGSHSFSSGSSSSSTPYSHHPHYSTSHGFQHDSRAQYFNPFEVKHRRRTTRTQFKVLEGTFSENPKPTATIRKQLSEQLDMPLRAVQIWFQNRRAKAKAVAKKEATGQGSSAAGGGGGSSSSSASRKDDGKEEDDDDERDNSGAGFRSRQTTGLTSDSHFSATEQDDRGLGLIHSESGQDSFFKMPNRPVRYGSGNTPGFLHQAGTTTASSAGHPMSGFGGSSSGPSSSSTTSSFGGTPFAESSSALASSLPSPYSYDHLQRPMSSTSSASSYAGGDERFSRRPLTGSSDSYNTAASFSTLTPSSSSTFSMGPTPLQQQQQQQHLQHQDFYGNSDASRRLSCPSNVSSMGANIGSMSPIHPQQQQQQQQQGHQVPQQSDEYGSSQAHLHSQWR